MLDSELDRDFLDTGTDRVICVDDIAVSTVFLVVPAAAVVDDPSCSTSCDSDS